MKRLVGLLTAVVLCLTVLASAALADSAEYASTQAVADKLDELEISYAVTGVTQGNEFLRIPYGDYAITLIFDEGLELTGIRVWDIITYDDADYYEVLKACNALNNAFRFAKFFADESDNTVTCGVDIIHRDQDVDDIVLEAVLRVLSMLDSAEEALAAYRQ